MPGNGRVWEITVSEVRVAAYIHACRHWRAGTWGAVVNGLMLSRLERTGAAGGRADRGGCGPGVAVASVPVGRRTGLATGRCPRARRSDPSTGGTNSGAD